MDLNEEFQAARTLLSKDVLVNIKSIYWALKHSLCSTFLDFFMLGLF